MGLEVYAGDVGGSVGSYSHFDSFRRAVSAIEGGEDHWGERFPRLMLHSDHDGGYTPQEAAELLDELCAIRQGLANLTVPAVAWLDAEGQIVETTSRSGPLGELAAGAEMAIGRDHRGLYIATPGDPCGALLTRAFGTEAEQSLPEDEEEREDVLEEAFNRITTQPGGPAFLDNLMEAAVVGKGQYAAARRCSEIAAGSDEFEFLRPIAPAGATRLTYHPLPASQAFSHILDVLTEVAEHSVANDISIEFR